MKGNPRQPFGVLRQGLLAVLLPEKPRIAEPRGEDFAVAIDDRRTAVRGGDIGGADEGVG